MFFHVEFAHAFAIADVFDLATEIFPEVGAVWNRGQGKCRQGTIGSGQ